MAKNSFVRFLFPLLFFLLLAFSCRSAPPVEEAEPPQRVVEIPAIVDSMETPGEIYWEIPEEISSEISSEVPSESPEPDEIPIEEADPVQMPETVFPPEQRPFQPVLVIELPEPQLPDLTPEQEEPQEALPVQVVEAETQAPPPAFPEQPPATVADPLPVPEALVQELPPPAQESPPLPPPFLAPPQPEIQPPSLEPDPAPLSPLPEIPGRSSAEPAVEQIVISRTVRVMVGQFLEIPFWGTGWVYLGELENRRGISYNSRRQDLEGVITIGQSFIFHAEAAGTYVLRFYRQDFILDYIINDHVQVIVEERREDAAIGPPSIAQSRVIAEPRWPPGLAAEGEIAEAEADPTEYEDILLLEEELAIEVPQPDPPYEYLRRARVESDAGRAEQAMDILDSMREHNYPETDEELWLYAQLLEANSPRRDIRHALELYRRIVREFPLSEYVSEAQRRIVYLERFFFNIR